MNIWVVANRTFLLRRDVFVLEQCSCEFGCPSSRGISRQLLEVQGENGTPYELWRPYHGEET